MRGIGSGWIVSVVLHAALLFVASRFVSSAIPVAADEPEVVMALDLRGSLSPPRAEHQVTEPRADGRAGVPDFSADELIESDSLVHELEATLLDGAGSDAASDVVAVRAGRSRAGVRISLARFSKPVAGEGKDGEDGARGTPTGAPAEATSSLFRPPELVSPRSIEYPSTSRRLHEEGAVRCRIHVNALGLVEAVEVLLSSGSGRLDEAARLGVAAWTFRPATRDGSPCACVVEHVVSFRLVSDSTSAR